MAYLTKFWKINYKNEMPGHQDIQSDKQDPGNLLAACGLGRSTSIFDGYVAKYMKTTKAPKIRSKKLVTMLKSKNQLQNQRLKIIKSDQLHVQFKR